MQTKNNSTQDNFQEKYFPGFDFFDFTSQQVRISPKFISSFLDVVKAEHYKKGAILLREGDVCHKIYMVQQGILRFYYFQEGKDITHWFLFEKDAITEVDSFFKKQVSEYYIEVLEDCSLLTISLGKLNQLFEEFTEMERLWRLVTTKIIVELGEKVKDLQFRNATERYERLIEKHPTILQRVALGHIASYLGITQQSLSRIRAQR